MSKIQWTDKTVNPAPGCTKVSLACDNCYAEKMAKRICHIAYESGNQKLFEKYAHTLDHLGKWNGKVSLDYDELDKFWRWKKSQKIFVNSMGDLFHENVPFEFLNELWAAMHNSDHHTFQILTKRPERMKEFVDWYIQHELNGNVSWYLKYYKHIWLGVTAENQEMVEKRIPILLQTPAAVRFVSVEPMLGPVDLRPWLKRYYHGGIPGLCIGELLLPPNVTGKSTLLEYAREIAPDGPQREDRVYLTTDKKSADVFAYMYPNGTVYRAIPNFPLEDDPDCLELGMSYQVPSAQIVRLGTPTLNWVICGGESGHKARPMHPDWARSLRDQCKAANVPFFFKQWGEWGPIEEVECGVLDDNAHRLSSNIIIGIKSTGVFDEGWNGTVTSPEMINDRPLWHLKRVGKKNAGHLLDGREWSEFPNVSCT